MTPLLACPVRGCGLLLDRGPRAWACARGHSFDVARSGYVNLLQPQDRRSSEAGDHREAVRARARLLDAGVGRTVLDRFVSCAVDLLHGRDRAAVVELGCGSGDALGALQARGGVAGFGIDLSPFAIDRAARRFPAVTWVVANADRRLPVADASADLVLSLHARRNPDECARILAPGGALLLGLPAAEDLIELREAVQGARVARDRVADVIGEHLAAFDVVDRQHVQERHQLDGERLRDLLRGTYRGERASAADRVRTLDALSVTLASELLALRRRDSAAISTRSS